MGGKQYFRGNIPCNMEVLQYNPEILIEYGLQTLNECKSERSVQRGPCNCSASGMISSCCSGGGVLGGGSSTWLKSIARICVCVCVFCVCVLMMAECVNDE